MVSVVVMADIGNFELLGTLFLVIKTRVLILFSVLRDVTTSLRQEYTLRVDEHNLLSPY